MYAQENPKPQGFRRLFLRADHRRRSTLPTSYDDTIKLIEELGFQLTTQGFGKKMTAVSQISLNSQWWH